MNVADFIYFSLFMMVMGSMAGWVGSVLFHWVKW